MRRATSTSGTATTAASRCSTATATFKREIKIDVPFDDNAKPAIGNKPDLSTYLQTGGCFTPGAPGGLCLTPRANQVLYSFGSYPGPAVKLKLDGKGVRLFRKTGQLLHTLGLIHENLF